MCTYSVHDSRAFSHIKGVRQKIIFSFLFGSRSSETQARAQTNTHTRLIDAQAQGSNCYINSKMWPCLCAVHGNGLNGKKGKQHDDDDHGDELSTVQSTMFRLTRGNFHARHVVLYIFTASKQTWRTHIMFNNVLTTCVRCTRLCQAFHFRCCRMSAYSKK